MKKIILLLIFFMMSRCAFANYKILVTGWEYTTDYDYRIYLLSPLKKNQLVLDCQSFIHEIVLLKTKNETSERLFEMTLDSTSCNELSDWIVSHTDMGGKLCFSIDVEAQTLSIDSDDYQFCY